jgi:hypothetical protein
MRIRLLGTVAAIVVGLAAAGCAHPVPFDPWLTTIDVQQAGSEAANDAGLNLYYGYQCSITGDPNDQTRFTADCGTTTGNGEATTLTGSGQADSSRHYHGTFVIKVGNKTVATLHCLGSEEAPRC